MKELAVMCVRTFDDVLLYPVVETVQRDNICHIGAPTDHPVF